jgi:hypothetical protein
MRFKDFILLGIFVILLISGCTTDSGYFISESNNCFDLGENMGHYEGYPSLSEAKCDQICVNNNYIPGNHKLRSDGYYYDCYCCEGDVKNLGCIYGNANLFIADHKDVEVLKSECKNTYLITFSF